MSLGESIRERSNNLFSKPLLNNRTMPLYTYLFPHTDASHGMRTFTLTDGSWNLSYKIGLTVIRTGISERYRVPFVCESHAGLISCNREPCFGIRRTRKNIHDALGTLHTVHENGACHFTKIIVLAKKSD